MAQPENVEALFAAARAEDASLDNFAPLLEAMRLEAIDQASGVEDVTSGLKAKRDEFKQKWEEEQEKAAKLSVERDTAARELQAARQEWEAKAAGVDSSRVNALADERADAKFSVLKSELAERIDGLESRTLAGDATVDALQEKLLTALIDKDLIVGAPAANPVLYKFLLDEAKQYYKPRTNGEDPWYTAPHVLFDIVDPKTGAKLKNGDSAFTGADLVKAKAGTDWKSFMVQTGRGGGAGGGFDAGAVSGRLPANASAADLMDSALSGPAARPPGG